MCLRCFVLVICYEKKNKSKSFFTTLAISLIGLVVSIDWISGGNIWLRFTTLYYSDSPVRFVLVSIVIAIALVGGLWFVYFDGLRSKDD